MADTYDAVTKLNELIKGINFVMLTTIRPNGSLHSCPMAAAEVDSDGLIWFFSSNNSEKVEAIKSDPRVNLACSDSSTQRYVSITGSAEPLRDHLKAEALWKSQYDAWFPKGIQDPDLILLRIRVRGAEYWDESVGRMTKLSGFANQP